MSKQDTLQSGRNGNDPGNDSSMAHVQIPPAQPILALDQQLSSRAPNAFGEGLGPHTAGHTGVLTADDDRAYRMWQAGESTAMKSLLKVVAFHDGERIVDFIYAMVITHLNKDFISSDVVARFGKLKPDTSRKTDVEIFSSMGAIYLNIFWLPDRDGQGRAHPEDVIVNLQVIKAPVWGPQLGISDRTAKKLGCLVEWVDC